MDLIVLKNDMLAANALFAIILLVFVGFFCVRMISNTKVSVATAGVMAGAIGLYYLYWNAWNFPQVTINHWVMSGMVCCIAAVAGIVVGLMHEETQEEYVHGRSFWCGLVLLGYSGLVCISHGVG